MSDKSSTDNCLKTPEKTNPDETDADVANSSIRSTRVPSSASKKQLKDSEKLRLKEEKDKQKLEEKVKKDKEKNDLKQKRENERLEKEREKNDMKQKKENEKMERELRRKQKEEEKKIKLEQIEEEKKKKEDAKQEEKKRKEDEKKKEEERLERKTEKEKQLMKNFFIKTAKDTTTPLQDSVSTNEIRAFMPFEVKPGMRLAPLMRFQKHFNIEECRARLDNIIADQACPGNYLQELREGLHKPKRSGSTWPRNEEEVVVIPSEVTLDPEYQVKRKMKLLQFHDNYRPAYYGTWNKMSQVISGKKPLALDSRAFDYEVESDEEWEEEEPGESISHSEGEDDGGDEEAEDNEDQFFVPHGYLSEGEGGDDDDLSPEAMKQKQLIMEHNWEIAMKENVQRLQPISIGVVRWHENIKLKDDQLEFLKKFGAQSIGVTFPISVGEIFTVVTNENKLDKRHRVQGVPEEAMPELIKLVHGCGFGIDKMSKEFKHFWTANHSNGDSNEDSEKSLISKRQLEAKIREIASYKKDPSRHPYRLWYVEKETLEKYNALDNPVPTAWVWLNKPSAKKLPQINSSMCETPKHERITREMKTPNMTASPATPCNKVNASCSIQKFITPATADAVSSDKSARRRVMTTLLGTGTPLTPGENANLSNSFASKRNQRKRSLSNDIQSESKRTKTDPTLTLREESSQECMIIDDEPVVQKGSCYVQLFKDSALTKMSLDDVVVIVDDDAIVKNRRKEENETAVPNSTPIHKNKTLSNFFKTLTPSKK